MLRPEQARPGIYAVLIGRWRRMYLPFLLLCYACHLLWNRKDRFAGSKHATSKDMSRRLLVRSTNFGGAVWAAPWSDLGPVTAANVIGIVFLQKQQKTLIQKCSKSAIGVQHESAVKLRPYS